MRRPAAIVFLGPSLPADEARRIFPGALVRGPARQGDVLAALRERPRVLALVDGVFETQRSVWHQELRIALAQGVLVLGASSMGALRAVELAPFGMRGVGRVYEAYAAGRLTDDADVALLHADRNHGFRSITVPFVNVLAAAEGAVARCVLSPAQGRALVQSARALSFDERDWEAVLDGARWDETTRRRFAAFRRENPGDVKADDARACLAEARKLRHAPPPAPVEPAPLSAWARRAWVAAQGAPPPGDPRPGLRTLLLAEWARAQGLAPEPAAVARIERRAPGLDAGLRRSWAEALSLEEQALARPERLLAQAPDAAEARWVDALRPAPLRARPIGSARRR